MSPKKLENRECMSRIPYVSVIGSLMYSMPCTRPDIAYAISITSGYQFDLGEEHWVAVKNILKYLRRTKDLILTYLSFELKIDGYIYSNFKSNVNDRKSTSGFIFLCNRGAASWKSSKQATTIDSTTEAKYICTSKAAKEGIWIEKFIIELGVVPSIKSTSPLYNNGAITQAKEPRSHQRAKHIQ
ncbi:secreted RxLR effector protein 161-like [Pistacia vera]|uniref:secreted RxLR effector protein 161-like n=1 Tax=Pistacia vera TaxID=55513 RepID=UPI001262FBD4|nr:secreted RxLR effector protein 161-like [Pistacia vera]